MSVSERATRWWVAPPGLSLALEVQVGPRLRGRRCELSVLLHGPRCVEPDQPSASRSAARRVGAAASPRRPGATGAVTRATSTSGCGCAAGGSPGRSSATEPAAGRGRGFIDREAELAAASAPASSTVAPGFATPDGARSASTPARDGMGGRWLGSRLAAGGRRLILPWRIASSSAASRPRRRKSSASSLLREGMFPGQPGAEAPVQPIRTGLASAWIAPAGRTSTFPTRIARPNNDGRGPTPRTSSRRHARPRRRHRSPASGYQFR